MLVQLNITYEALVELVEQLPSEQRQALVRRLQDERPAGEPSADEKLAMLRAVQYEVQVMNEPSDRREDWYDDEGR